MGRQNSDTLRNAWRWLTDEDYFLEQSPRLAAGIQGFKKGATLNFADEIDAAGRAALDPNATYDDYIDPVRDQYDALREAHPNISGAAGLAGNVGLGLLTAPIAGASATAPLATRLAAGSGIGAGEGAIDAIGRGEGADRLNPARIGGQAVAGAAGGAAGELLLRPIIGFIGRKLGTRSSEIAERWIRKEAAQSDRPIDAIVNDIAEGRILAEDNVTMREAAKKIRNAHATQPQVAGMERLAQDRAADRTGRLFDTIDESLTQGRAIDSNLRAVVAQSDEQLRKSFDPKYEQAYASRPDPSDATVRALEDIIGRDASTGRALLKSVRLATKESPFFIEGPNGSIEFIRRPTIKEAELVRKSLAGHKSAAYREGNSDLIESFERLEGQLRGLIDLDAPQVAATRQEYSEFMDGVRGFRAGDRQAALAQPEQFALDVSNAREKPDMLGGFELGTAANLRGQRALKNNTGLARKYADPAAAGYRNMGELIGEDVMESIGPDALSALDLQQAFNKGPGTAKDLMAAQSVRGGADAVAEVVRGDTLGIAARTADWLARDRGLNARQAGRVADILTSEDPALVRRVLEGNGAERDIGMLRSAVARILGAETAQTQAGPSLTDWLESTDP